MTITIHLADGFTPRQLADMALELGDDIDLGNATGDELDRLVLRYYS